MDDPTQSVYYFSKNLDFQYLGYKDVLSAYSLYVKILTENEQGLSVTNDLITENPDRISSSDHPWSRIEIEALIQGINMHGIGNWSQIRSTFSAIFNEHQRTREDLINEWNLLQRNAKYKRIDINEMAAKIK